MRGIERGAEGERGGGGGRGGRRQQEEEGNRIVSGVFGEMEGWSTAAHFVSTVAYCCLAGSSIKTMIGLHENTRQRRWQGSSAGLEPKNLMRCGL